MSATTRPLLSIITPCYNEQDNVEPCYLAVRKLFETELADCEYEHIFADNASEDSTFEKLRSIAGKDPRVKVILNSRNFGPLASTFNALHSASGHAVVPFLPADLQDAPDVIVDFVRHWREGYRVVYGIRRNREEPLLMRAVRHAFYVTIDKLSETPLPLDAGEFQLIDRVVVDALCTFEDYNPYLRGMIAHCGFRSIGVAYTWKARTRGKSKTSWYGMFDLAMNAFVSFSNIPVRVCLLIGFLLAFASVFYAFLQLALAVLFPRAAPGIPTIVAGLFFFGGVQIFFLGILGEYVSAIHSQVRRKPLVIEAERINFTDGGRRSATGQRTALPPG